MAVAQKGKQASQALSPAIENLNVKKKENRVRHVPT
jgi:hypothetical protein